MNKEDIDERDFQEHFRRVKKEYPGDVQSESASRYDFLAGRKGMVPLSALDAARATYRSEVNILLNNTAEVKRLKSEQNEYKPPVPYTESKEYIKELLIIIKSLDEKLDERDRLIAKYKRKGV